ncbi:MAG: tetratricopeptide repeat protein [Deltaproteobacteria bacterium]|nr:tetratricopeptide repeat protein [Deltaproteobacteria bacterium]
MNTRSRVLGLGLCLLWSPCCDQGGGAALEAEPVVVGPATVEVAVGPPTTDGATAQRNLTAQIDGLRDAVERGLVGPDVTDALIDALLTRAQFFGTWRDFDEALELSAQRLAMPDASSAVYERRARVLAAVHLFPQALAVLESSPPDEGVAAAAVTIGEAIHGGSEEIVAARQRLAERETRTLGEQIGLARALAGVGRFEEADAAYVEAAASYGDVSPLPIAWIAFSRGVMWGEVAGRPDLARPLYEHAVGRLPGYVVANVHLAELEVEAGELARATERLAGLPLDSIVDPEPDAVLGRVTNDDAIVARALAGYEQMLALHPEAVWDHATEFFLSGADAPARAFELAALNLALRQTERAYLLALRAALAVGDDDEARRLATLVAPPIHTASLRALVEEILG